MKRVLLLSLVLGSAVGCKKKESGDSASADPLLGQWQRGEAGKCIPVVGPTTRIWVRERFAIKLVQQRYRYEAESEYFLSPSCQLSFFKLIWTGWWVKIEAVEALEDPSWRMRRYQKGAQARISDAVQLHRANLMTEEGWAGQKGLRLCGLAQDWQLGRWTPVAGGQCPTWLPAEAFDGAPHLLQVGRRTRALRWATLPEQTIFDYSGIFDDRSPIWYP